MTLNDLERRNSLYFPLFLLNSIALQADCVTLVENRPIMSAKYRLPVIFGQNWSTSSRTLSLRQLSFLLTRFSEITLHKDSLYTPAAANCHICQTQHPHHRTSGLCNRPCRVCHWGVDSKVRFRGGSSVQAHSAHCARSIIRPWRVRLATWSTAVEHKPTDYVGRLIIIVYDATA